MALSTIWLLDTAIMSLSILDILDRRRFSHHANLENGTWVSKKPLLHSLVPCYPGKSNLISQEIFAPKSGTLLS